jgi:hypothetical protein
MICQHTLLEQDLPLLKCTSIVPDDAFKNTSPLNAPVLCQVMLFKMPAI